LYNLSGILEQFHSGGVYMAQVFISYSRKDLSFVKRLVADLKNVGLDVWHDVSSLGGGSRWRIEIETAIRNSQFVVVVLSPDSITSEWVEREFLFASNLKRKIIPLMCRSCEMPLNYVDLNYIDLQGKKYTQNFDKLLRSLNSVPMPTAMPSTTVKKPFFTIKTLMSPTVALLLLLLAISILLIFGIKAAFLVTPMTPVPTSTSIPPPTSTAYLIDTPVKTLVVVTSTEETSTISPTFTFTPVSENTITVSPSLEPKTDKMTAILQASMLEGKAPLKVNFNARTSYAQFADGSIVACGATWLCDYTFTIYRDSKLVYTIKNNEGFLSYTFGGKGQYIVGVCVCRGEACNDDGVTINAR
jgi:hypothetical protein